MFTPLSPNRLPEIEDIQTNRALPPINLWVVRGGWFMITVLVTFAGLTPVVRYRTVVKAPMTVRPEGELRLVQSSVEGFVVTILVGENQQVDKGQTIATIDSSQFSTRKEQLEESIDETQNQIAKVDAQIALISDQVVAEKERVATTIAIAEAELAGSQRRYSDRQTTAEAEVREAQANVQLTKEELLSYKQLVEQGAVAQLELAHKQAALEAASARLYKLTAALNPTNSDVIVSQIRIAQTRTQGAVAISQLIQTQFQLMQQRSELKGTLNNSNQELEQVIKDLNLTDIRAPISGVIQLLNLRNTEQVIRIGETVAKIFPESAELNIRALVPTGDISKVKVGQTVNMRISTCPFSEFGTLPGIVYNISPDTIAMSDSENINQTDEFFYNVIIQPQRLALGEGDKECHIQSGLEGRADIVTRKESVLNFILRKVSLVL